MLKCLERRASMYGTDGPSRVDMAVVAAEMKGSRRARSRRKPSSGSERQAGYFPKSVAEPEPEHEAEP
jgi:hypothetical protein